MPAILEQTFYRVKGFASAEPEPGENAGMSQSWPIAALVCSCLAATGLVAATSAAMLYWWRRRR